MVLDVMLPDGSGFELCKKIKAEHPEKMVLMMSGFDIKDLNAKLIDSEADDFLTKPFSPMELVARIEMLGAKMRRKPRRAPGGEASTGHDDNRVPHVGDNIGDYAIIDSLGWGKNSVVYKVVKKGSSEIFAVKLLTKYSMEFKDVVQRFEAEREVMSSLPRHPNLIQLIESGSWNNCPYIVMEYLQGANLEERLVTEGPPSTKLAFEAASQIAEGLAAMHDAGVLHRDIKLKNIMFNPDSRSFKLTDFGIARFMERAPGITCDGFIVGTPMYMAPEIFRGELATPQSDIYSYGATLYHFAAGAPPFSAPRNSEMYKKHLSEQPKAPSSLNPAIPPKLDELIFNCLAKTPEDRPASMRKVAETLASLLPKTTNGLS
jgi:serine/threonine-protein kinase